MKFKIINYADLEQVKTELVILRGYIEMEDSTGKVIDSSDITIKLEGESSSNHQSHYIGSGSMRVIQDSFSALITLFQGMNLITFHYKTKLIEAFHLIYDAAPNSLIHLSVKPVIVYSTFHHADVQGSDCNGTFTSYFNRIDIGLKLVQWYFGEKLVEAGFPRCSFTLTNPTTFSLSIDPATIQSMTSNELWEEVAKGIRADPDLWSNNYKYVAFLLHPWKQVTSTSSEESTSTFALEPKSAVAGGGLVLLDHKLFLAWPEKLDELFTALEDPAKVPDHTSLTPLMSTVGRQFGATLGIVAHELGHVFDLGHLSWGLMGKDFHRFALTFQPKIKTALGLKTKRVWLTFERACEDPVQLCLSFLTLLHYNRWFRTCESDAGSDSRISLEKNLIISTTNISVVEVRDPDSSIVISSWIGDETQKRTSFTLSKRFIPIDWAARSLELVVQNVSGTILKATVNFSCFPQGFLSRTRTHSQLLLL